MIEELLNNRIVIRESSDFDQETEVIVSPSTEVWTELNLLRMVLIMKSDLF